MLNIKNVKQKLLIASLAIGVLGLSSNVSAGPISVGGGWTTVSFGGVGSNFSEEPYTFTLAGNGLLKVTDAFAIGDTFDIYDSGLGLLFSTSLPNDDGANAGNDYDFAYADTRWSSGSIELSAGSYSITAITTASPFGGGDAGLMVSNVVNSPATLALFAIGFAGLGWSKRKKA
jgi:hypothetical protein